MARPCRVAAAPTRRSDCRACHGWPRIHADDTPVPVLAPGAGKTKTGRQCRPCSTATRPTGNPRCNGSHSEASGDRRAYSHDTAADKYLPPRYICVVQDLGRDRSHSAGAARFASPNGSFVRRRNIGAANQRTLSSNNVMPLRFSPSCWTITASKEYHMIEILG